MENLLGPPGTHLSYASSQAYDEFEEKIKRLDKDVLSNENLLIKYRALA